MKYNTRALFCQNALLINAIFQVDNGLCCFNSNLAVGRCVSLVTETHYCLRDRVIAHLVKQSFLMIDQQQGRIVALASALGRVGNRGERRQQCVHMRVADQVGALRCHFGSSLAAILETAYLTLADVNRHAPEHFSRMPASNHLKAGY